MTFVEKIKAVFNADKELQKKNDEIRMLDEKYAKLSAEKQETLSKLEEQRNERESKIKSLDAKIADRDGIIAEIIKGKQDEIDKYDQIITQRKESSEHALKNYTDTVNEKNKIAEEITKLTHTVELNKAKIKTAKALYQSIRKVLDDYATTGNLAHIDFSEFDKELISPTVTLPLHALDVKDLRSLNTQNKKLIDDTLKRYELRYNTKTNKALYQLIVLGVRAELQNILSDMKYSTYDKCKAELEEMFIKYKNIIAEGNQQILNTVTSFLAEVSVLFTESLNIEYEYYVRKEQAKAEQQAIREQMRQEAAEQKELERQQKLVEQEENKYRTEMSRVESLLADCADEDKIKELELRIAELKNQLLDVEVKKERIVNLQNGKAGTVYIISNLGSFGDNMFKIGMTRRQDPMERVRELGDASVPFSFDVHSFIFSQDAVALETELHHRLNDKRTNKVNLRKEFFTISIDELEKLVQEIDNTAEFNRTMLANEFRQSQEM